MCAILSLVPVLADQETVKALELLLEQAKAGEVMGLAYVAIHRGHGYSGNVVGVAEDAPMLVRGVCRALEDQIAKLPRK
jgi:uncharacterized protein (UPF0210 family)